MIAFSRADPIIKLFTTYEVLMELQQIIEAGGLVAVSGVSLYFAMTFLKMYRQAVASHIKTLKLAARLPISEDDTHVRPPAANDAL